MPKLLPLRDYLLIRHDPEPETLVLRPDAAAKVYTPELATVVAVGDMVNFRELDPSFLTDHKYCIGEGDRVLVESRHAGTPVKVEGEDLIMIHDRLIMGVVR